MCFHTSTPNTINCRESPPLASQKVTLTITQNKKQLINIICGDLQSDIDFHQKYTEKHKLMITGQES